MLYVTSILLSLYEGKTYQPDYKNSQLITDLLEIFDLKQFGNQVVMKDNIKIFKKNFGKPLKCTKMLKREIHYNNCRKPEFYLYFKIFLR